MIGNDGKGAAIRCDVAFICHAEESQSLHSRNIATKSGMNRWDKRLDGDITNGNAALSGILAGSLGAGQNRSNVSVRVWEWHFKVSVNLLFLSSPTTTCTNPILTQMSEQAA